MRPFAIAGCLFAATLLAGCSGPSSEPTRYRVSGEATFNGNPIPYGDVLFTPDGANAGPQGIADIRDGKYDTAAARGKGIAGGPTVVRVTGLSGPPPGGKLLCEYEYRVELPREDTTHKVEVPPEGAAGNQVKPPEI